MQPSVHDQAAQVADHYCKEATMADFHETMSYQELEAEEARLLSRISVLHEEIAGLRELLNIIQDEFDDRDCCAT